MRLKLENNDYRNDIYDHYLTNNAHTNSVSQKEHYNRLQLHKFLLGKLPQDLRSLSILDLGAGDGELVQFLQNNNCKNVTGCDISAEQIEASKLRVGVNIKHMEIWDALAERRNDSTDIIFTIDLIEHLTREELIRLGKEIFRVLKKDGMWFMHAPNGSSPFFGDILYGDYTHQQAFTRLSLTQILRSFGFLHLNFYESGPFTNSQIGYIRIALWKILKIFYAITNFAETGERIPNQILTRNIIAIAKKSNAHR